MAVINDKYKFIFFCTPHTASRTVRDGLMTLEGSRETSTYHHINLDRAIHNRFIRKHEVPSYFMFATIRDPHDWMTTDWLIKTGGRESLRQYMVNRHHGMHKDGTIFWQFLKDVHVFIRYETIQASIDKVLRAVQAPAVDLDYKPGYKTQDKKHWREYWTERDFKAAQQFFPDIERYGYLPGYNVEELDPIVRLPA